MLGSDDGKGVGTHQVIGPPHSADATVFKVRGGSRA